MDLHDLLEYARKHNGKITIDFSQGAENEMGVTADAGGDKRITRIVELTGVADYAQDDIKTEFKGVEQLGQKLISLESIDKTHEGSFIPKTLKELMQVAYHPDRKKAVVITDEPVRVALLGYFPRDEVQRLLHDYTSQQSRFLKTPVRFNREVIKLEWALLEAVLSATTDKELMLEVARLTEGVPQDTRYDHSTELIADSLLSGSAAKLFEHISKLVLTAQFTSIEEVELYLPSGLDGLLNDLRVNSVLLHNELVMLLGISAAIVQERDYKALDIQFINSAIDNYLKYSSSGLFMFIDDLLELTVGTNREVITGHMLEDIKIAVREDGELLTSIKTQVTAPHQLAELFKLVTEEEDEQEQEQPQQPMSVLDQLISTDNEVHYDSAEDCIEDLRKKRAEQTQTTEEVVREEFHQQFDVGIGKLVDMQADTLTFTNTAMVRLLDDPTNKELFSVVELQELEHDIKESTSATQFKKLQAVDTVEELEPLVVYIAKGAYAVDLLQFTGIAGDSWAINPDDTVAHLIQLHKALEFKARAVLEGTFTKYGFLPLEELRELYGNTYNGITDKVKDLKKAVGILEFTDTYRPNVTRTLAATEALLRAFTLLESFTPARVFTPEVKDWQVRINYLDQSDPIPVDVDPIAEVRAVAQKAGERARINDILLRYQEGVEREELVKVYGITYDELDNLLTEFNIPIRPEAEPATPKKERIEEHPWEKHLIEDYKAGKLTVTQLATKYHIATGSMYKILDKHRIPRRVHTRKRPK